jgi:hypothetical protein
MTTSCHCNDRLSWNLCIAACDSCLCAIWSYQAYHSPTERSIAVVFAPASPRVRLGGEAELPPGHNSGGDIILPHVQRRKLGQINQTDDHLTGK